MASARSTRRTEGTMTQSSGKGSAELSARGAGPIQNVGQGERIVSGIVGGLLLHALSPRSMISAVAFLVAGGLLYRAFTGHCPVYRMVDESSGEHSG